MTDGYTVTSVQQSQQVGPAGSLQDVVVVSFDLTAGTGSGSVTVPLAGDWSSAARTAIEAQVAQMYALLKR